MRKIDKIICLLMLIILCNTNIAYGSSSYKNENINGTKINYVTVNRKAMNDPIEFFDDLDEEMKDQIELAGILVDIASNIINYRVDNGLTQKELADRLNISQAMVSKLESGDYNPSVEFLFNISKKLGFNLVIELK